MCLEVLVRPAHRICLALLLFTACGGDDDDGSPDDGADSTTDDGTTDDGTTDDTGDDTGDDGSGSVDAAPSNVLLVSSCFGLGCPLGECASLTACDAAGYNGGSFDFEDSNQFCGAGDPVDLCMTYDGTFQHVSCAGLTVVREGCSDGCAFDEVVECAYCAEDPSCAEDAAAPGA